MALNILLKSKNHIFPYKIHVQISKGDQMFFFSLKLAIAVKNKKYSTKYLVFKHFIIYNGI